MSEAPTPPPRPDLEDEVIHYDDATIGRAFRWSLVVFAMLGITVAVALHYLRRRPAPPPPRVSTLSAPLAPAAQAVLPPYTPFTDITREAGITFRHQNGAYGEKLLPETMGGGVAFLDYDADGLPDLLFVNSAWWPWKPLETGAPPTLALYHNEGGGRFQDVTAGSGLHVSLYGMGVAAGDYDNDGLVDVFISAVGGGRLFHNQGGGHFRDITAQSGVGGYTNDWSTCCTWFDYDNDGRLDLFVGNYVRWSREIDAEVGYKLVGGDRAYGQPNNFLGAFPYLYHNDGNGRFTDVSARSGVQVKNPATGVPVAKPLGVAPVDVDGDGWTDLVVANDTVQNLVLLNRRDGSFAEVGAATGVAFDSYGNTRGAMGIDTARFRNDDALGIVIGNFANEMTALYVAQGGTTNFTDEAITEQIGPASRRLLKFGTFFLDYDLDGWLDLLSANGHLEEEISKIQQSQTYAQPAQLFWNVLGSGEAGFAEVGTNKAGADLFQPIVGRGGACADIDGDGDLDVVLTQVSGPPLLLRNDQQLGHHWLRVKLRGTTANRDALGAWVRLTAGGVTQARQVNPTRGYLSQSELPLTFGLGDATRIDRLEVLWPGGGVQAVPNPEIDRAIVVNQEAPRLSASTASASGAAGR